MNDKESAVFVPRQEVLCSGNGLSPDDSRNISRAYLSLAMKEARERKLGKVTSKHFTTVFHESVYRELVRMFIALRDDSFVDKTGNFTKILLGPRGIAKTTCLKNFISTAPLLAVGVASLFLSYTSEKSLSAEVEGGIVQSVCGKIAKSFGWETTEVNDDETYPDYIVRKLTECDTKLVLVVDEVDQLFKANEKHPAFFEFAHKTLSELATLGNNTCGRLMIVLSGSSSRLRYFVRGSSTEFSYQEKADYPLLSRNLNMNSHRYKTLLATYPRPDSLVDSLAILHPSDDLVAKGLDAFTPSSKVAARAKMFEFGCNPRALDDQSTTISETVVPTDNSCGKLWMQLLVLWYGYRTNRKLLVSLGKRKQTRRDLIYNRERWLPYVCDECKKQKAKTCVHATSKWSWEQQFKPVSRDTMYRSRGPELACQLDKLQYEGYLVLIEGDIYPASLGLYVENLKCWATSLSQLVRRRISLFCTTSDDQLDLVDGLSDFARDLIKEALKSGISHV